jgi:hypothetical protein
VAKSTTRLKWILSTFCAVASTVQDGKTFGPVITVYIRRCNGSFWRWGSNPGVRIQHLRGHNVDYVTIFRGWLTSEGRQMRNYCFVPVPSQRELFIAGFCLSKEKFVSLSIRACTVISAQVLSEISNFFATVQYMAQECMFNVCITYVIFNLQRREYIYIHGKLWHVHNILMHVR